MPVNSSYSWENSSSKGTLSPTDPNRSLKVWLVVAAGVSLIVHLALWMIFRTTTLPANSVLVKLEDKTRTFKVDRVTIREKPEVEINSMDEQEMAEILDANAASLVQEFDQEDPNMFDKLPENEVRLTPEPDKMSAFASNEKPTVAGANNDLSEMLAPETSFSTAELEEAIDSIQNRIKLPDRVSDNQLAINPDDEGEEILMGDDLEAMKLAMAKAAGNSDITGGFSNLDDLLNQEGPLLDGTKPILIPTDLLFQFNAYDVEESARFSLMKLGLLIKRNQDSRFIIEGHTDTLGSEEYNMQLSLKRAQAVQAWLVESLGLGEDRVEVKGFGETRPLVAAGDQDAQAINRRVEIAIKPTVE